MTGKFLTISGVILFLAGMVGYCLSEDKDLALFSMICGNNLLIPKEIAFAKLSREKNEASK